MSLGSVPSVACCNAYGTLVPPFNSGANAAPVSVQALPVQCHYSTHGTGTAVGRGSSKTTSDRVLDIMCLTWGEWSYPQLLLPGDYPTR